MLRSEYRQFEVYASTLEALFAAPPFKRLVQIVENSNVGEKQELRRYLVQEIKKRLGGRWKDDE